MLQYDENYEIISSWNYGYSTDWCAAKFRDSGLPWPLLTTWQAKLRNWEKKKENAGRVLYRKKDH